MERFTVAISTQLKVKASAKRAWVRLHEFENLHNVFSTVHSAESVGSPWVVGSKIKVTRKLPTGHCFLATYNIVKHDEENMEFQFYSEDIASPGAATVSTSWKVEPLGEDSCMVTISIAVAPRKMIVSAGRLIFAPLLRRMVNKTINQDLKDLAASFENEKELKKALLQHTTNATRPVSLANARRFEEPKEANSERTRSTIASYDDVPSSGSTLTAVSELSYASRATPLGRLDYAEEFTNIRQVRSDGRVWNHAS